MKRQTVEVPEFSHRDVMDELICERFAGIVRNERAGVLLEHPGPSTRWNTNARPRPSLRYRLVHPPSTTIVVPFT